MRTLKNRVRNWLRGARGEGRVRNPRGGFTLMELIVVMAIIAILAGIAMPALRAARREAMEARARAMIASLGMALSMYETDFGAFPTKHDPPVGFRWNFRQHEILSLLTGRDPVNWEIDTDITGNPRWRGPYLEVRREDLRRIYEFPPPPPPPPVVPPPPYHLIDPWGTPYVICVALDRDPATRPLHNVFGFDIFSLGPDGRTYEGVRYEFQAHAEFVTDDPEDGHTAAGVEGDVNLRYLLDDINNW